MRLLSPRLRRLDEALADLTGESEAMLLSELDGYLAGVIVCPDVILPSEWLPLVWGSDGDVCPFADDREAEWYAELVMDHYNALIRTLNRGSSWYKLFLEVDARHKEVLWELWIDGFESAMKLRPDSWAQIVESIDDQAAAAVSGIITLGEIAQDESDLDRENIDTLTELAPALIPQLVTTINTWRLDYCTPAPALMEARRTGKVGRNDPCPCGSGKKYKKCCGLN